jgi:acetolactate synthase-1/2/3 large subunit
MDSIPIVAITGQVKTSLIGNDAFQEADVIGITRPITKHSYLVKKAEDLSRVVQEAFYIAGTGRPGPVLIDLPVDVALQEAEYARQERPRIRGYNPTYEGHPGQIKRVAKAVAESKRPIIYAGGGIIISGAHAELREFAEKIETPVTTTLLGLGGFPAEHPLFLGMLGMHGTAYANHAIMESDLIIAIGARFDDRVTGKLDEFAPLAKIIHIDIDPCAISKNIEVDIPIVGDARNVLKELNKIATKPDTSAWLKQINLWKENYPMRYKKDGRLKPQFVVEQISELTNGDAIICTEVGQNQMWTAQYYRFKNPRSFISSGGLGTMGYGFPAAIGAQSGCPDKLVIDIAGDGSFQMNIQELATAVINKIPVKVAILNNRYLGMVRQWQELFYSKRYSHSCLAQGPDCPPECPGPSDACPDYIPDFVKVAEAYGAVGIRVTKEEEVRPALQKAFSTPRPVVIDFIVHEEENVFPIVPAGKAINQMIGGLA